MRSFGIRRLGIILAVGSMAMLPLTASATVYNFNDIESSALSSLPVNYIFSLDTAKAVGSASGTTFNNVVITMNGVPVTGNSVGATFTTNLSSPLFFLIDTSMMPFYSGTGTGITFNTGTFAIADGATDGEGTLTISRTAATPTPEPATWALLLTGCALIAAASDRFRKSRLSSPASL